MSESSESRLIQKLQAAPALVAYFSTPTCNVCKVLRPKVEAMVADFEGVEFQYVDSSLYPAVAGQHVVFAVPTIILFVDGREMRRFSRNFSTDDFERSLKNMLP
ncbi:thioredoxin family protein [bacterium]|nr:thioredoxin family protein [bacterium]